LGGYSYQTAISLLPADFSFVGVMATYNLFDFGKRERTVKERQTNLQLTQMNLEGVKAKVAASVQKTYLELERVRRTRDLARRLFATYETAAPTKQDVALNEKAERAPSSRWFSPSWSIERRICSLSEQSVRKSERF
jgi:outer membrane protein TolC